MNTVYYHLFHSTTECQQCNKSKSTWITETEFFSNVTEVSNFHKDLLNLLLHCIHNFSSVKFLCMVWSAILMECVILDFLVGIFDSFKHAHRVEFNTQLIVCHIWWIYILIDCLNSTPLWWCFTWSVCIMIFYSNWLWYSNFIHYSFGKMYDYLHQYLISPVYSYSCNCKLWFWV